MDKKTFATLYFGIAYFAAIGIVADQGIWTLIAFIAGPAILIAAFWASMKLYGEA